MRRASSASFFSSSGDRSGFFAARGSSIGGGGGAFRETPQEERHALLRVDDARQKGASIIVTACPLCLLMLEDALRVRNLEEKIQVRDLADLLWEATREAPQEAP